MQHDQEFVAKLGEAVSCARLDAYKHAGDDSPLHTVQRYLWNTALSEAFYPAMQGVEIGLRNALDLAVTRVRGEDWLFDGSVLLPREQAIVLDLAGRLGHTGPETTRHGCLGGLGFGFWTALLSRSYDGVLWPELTAAALPLVPRRIRSRSELGRRANAVRKLRNRVSHHEPIWHWHDLESQHRAAGELLGWLSPELASCVAAVDRFESVRCAGWGQYADAVAAIIERSR